MLAKRESKSRYSTSILDYAWIIAGPSIYAVVFYFVRRELSASGITIDTGGVNPILYAFIGVLMWQVWFDTLLKQIDVFKYGKPFLRAQPMNPEVFFFAICLSSFADLFVRLLLIAIAMIVMLEPPGSYAVWTPAIAIILLMTANVIGFLLALPGSFFSDIVKSLQSISLGLFLASPIFYAVPNDTSAVLYQLNVWNPFGASLAVLHGTLHGGTFPTLSPFLAWGSGLLLILPLLILLYRRVGPLIVERL